MNRTANSSKFNIDGSIENDVDRIDKKKGKSAAFKAVTRGELDRIKGTRPHYEKDFRNDFNRYNIKYLDPKIKGKA